MRMLSGLMYLFEHTNPILILFGSYDSKILILSGSHGTKEGVSGLTDKDSRNVDGGYVFYKEDCELLGIKPGPPKRRLPLRNWNNVPDITKPAEKLVDFAQDPCLQNMDIRVCNICYYHGNSQKLLRDIEQVGFFVIMISKAFIYYIFENSV